MVELKYKDITEKIIGASFEVHKFLGNARLNGTGRVFRKLFIKERWHRNYCRQGLLMQEKLNRKFFTKNFQNLLEREGLILLWKGKSWLN